MDVGLLGRRPRGRVTLVPERCEELTTEGGLDVVLNGTSRLRPLTGR